jgi:tetratricopeptide (TPR) repeat protein
MFALRPVLLLAFEAVFCMLATTTALAQTDDIFERLRRALASSGEGELASAALAKKNFIQVEEILARTRASTPQVRAELLSLQGAVDFLDRKMSAAIAAFCEAAKLAPLRDSDSFTLAMAWVNLGDDTDARAQLASLAQKYPERAIYIYWLGRLDYYQRRYEQSVEKLKKAAELDPKSARIWDSLGLAFDMQGKLEQALGAFENAAALNRDEAHPSPWPPHDLGYLLLRMEKSKEAEEALRESLRYDPKLVQAHYHLGRALEKQGKDTEAIDEYVTATSGDTESADACYSLAMLYRNLHRNAEANAMFAEFKKRKQAIASSDLNARGVRE